MDTNPKARRRTWPRRRILGSALGIAVVVGTGAVAQASPNGDGFFSRSAGPATAAQAYHGSTGYTSDGHSSQSSGSASSSWQNSWTWSGHDTNRWGFQTVVDPKDPTFNQALGINDKGVIVGYFGSGADASHPNHGWWTSSSSNGQAFHDVDYPGSVQTQVVGINDDGTVVGFYVEADGSNHGFVRWHGRYFTVDAPWTSSKPSFNQLLGISRNGIAAGVWNDKDGNAHGYLFDTRTHRYTSIRLPWGATSVTVTGVNDDGTVVGFAVVKKVTVAFVLNHHTAVVIKLGDDKNTQALGINRWGVVVGSYEDRWGNTQGFVWAKGKLRTVTVPWNPKSTVVNGISDSGWIVGFFEDSSGNTKGFVARQ